MDIVQAIVLAIVEGLTEFLPISSTAHMIFTSTFMGIQKDEFVKMFQVAIQFGAILAVVVFYWRRFFNFRRWQFYLKLAIGVVPALVLGKLFDDMIEEVLEKPLPIAVVLIVGGVILLFIDKVFTRPRLEKEEEITYGKAVAVGFWQCLAMMPGTSRSAASIIGGMQQGMSRSLAAEFSFYLAVPTMLAVCVYSIFVKDWTFSGAATTTKGYEMLMSNSSYLTAFAVGNAVAFVVALLAIRFFIGFLKKYGFRVWGWYRIIVGLILLGLFLSGTITA